MIHQNRVRSCSRIAY